MQIKIGFEITYTAPQPTPMVIMLSIHPSRYADIVGTESIAAEPDVPIGLYRDGGDVVVTLNGTEDFRVTDNATELAGNLRSGIFGKNDVKTEKYAVDFGMTAFNVGV